ncbi:MAG: gliding motility protein GldN, partial [Chitinophagales bacterium]
AYADEEFTIRMSYSKVMKSLSDSTSKNEIDTSTGDIIGSHMVFQPFNADSMTKWQIKEDLYFDKVRGRLITQIVYLAPWIRFKNSKGEYEAGSDRRPFFLYFPQVRKALAGRQVFDTQRDLYDVSYDDIFVSRKFKSLIVKESNPADNRIKDYPGYADDVEKQKKEAARIEEEIRNYKKILWKY